MLVFDKDKAYMEVLCEFRKMIDSEFKEGGWLPSVRELSKRFNVSTGTITKAENCLIAESIAESFLRKGIYIIPEKFRVRKIGLVVGDGRESPFLAEAHNIAGILAALKNRGYDCHLIQGRPALNVVRCALTNCVTGLIWLSPPRDAYSTLLDIRREKIFPLITVSSYDSFHPEDRIPDEIPNVSEDSVLSKAKAVDLLLDRGHSKFGHVAGMSTLEYNGIAAKLKKAGIIFDESCCTDSNIPDSGEIGKMVLEQGITALLVEGGPRSVDFVFSELSTLSDDKQPEIIVHNHSMIPEISRAYPNVKLVAVHTTPDRNKMAEAAVDMLLDNLKRPDKIKSIKVDSTCVQPMEEILNK